MKLMINPLMCEPSWSWSVMIMMEPYRNPRTSEYSVPASKAMILITWSISLFSSICFTVSSLTFRNFPRRGNTPKRSRPTTPRPATAKAFAESPSVRISVHSPPFLVPASLASSSLGIPKMRFVRPMSLRLRCCANSLLPSALDHSWSASMMPLLSTSSSRGSGTAHSEPNLACLLMSVSLVCESKAGFSIKQFTNTIKYPRTC
mmetsp:Transcript_43036/g.77214  ORF Transcript_43036/g.77214 Transcript_43036/m.77214 type:complete len:204 (-) Transcript_43036:1565-2176(-)